MPRKTTWRVDHFPLLTTEGQRKSLLVMARLPLRYQNRLKAATAAQPALFNRKELDEVASLIGGSAVYAPPEFKQDLIAVERRILDLLDAADEGETPPPQRPTGARPLLQFKITLLEIEPAIWRRIQIEDGTLADLHYMIQGAFGWEDSHLHQFIISGERYGPPPPEELGLDVELDWIDETTVMISDVLPASGRARWRYEYDFGDDWIHEIQFEAWPERAAKTKYPLCVDGARACPPEDCGGPYGYEHLLYVLSDPDEERHEEYLEWYGKLDPESFDAKQATRAMRRLN
jgi:hypothetical protein